MLTKLTKTLSLLLALIFILTTTAHAGGLIDMITGRGKDRRPQTSGKVTVRGLSRYESKYVMGVADTDPALLAAGNIPAAA